MQSYKVWCFSCYISVLLWPHSSLLEWECIFCDIKFVFQFHRGITVKRFSWVLEETFNVWTGLWLLKGPWKVRLNAFCIMGWPWAYGSPWKNVVLWMRNDPLTHILAHLIPSWWCCLEKSFRRQSFVGWGTSLTGSERLTLRVSSPFLPCSESLLPVYGWHVLSQLPSLVTMPCLPHHNGLTQHPQINPFSLT